MRIFNACLHDQHAARIATLCVQRALKAMKVRVRNENLAASNGDMPALRICRVDGRFHFQVARMWRLRRWVGAQESLPQKARLLSYNTLRDACLLCRLGRNCCCLQMA
jgi:hypothetical protein